MADRRVNTASKDKRGAIVMLGNSTEYWLFEHIKDVIRHIEEGIHSYYVSEAGYRSDIRVHTDAKGEKHLRTTANGTSTNNLHNLPDC